MILPTQLTNANSIVGEYSTAIIADTIRWLPELRSYGRLMGVQVKVIDKGLVAGLIGREIITVFPDPNTPPVISFLSGIATDPGPHSLPAACPVLAGQ
jgi:hypothetical protein